MKHRAVVVLFHVGFGIRCSRGNLLKGQVTSKAVPSTRNTGRTAGRAERLNDLIWSDRRAWIKGLLIYELGITPGPLSGHLAIVASSMFRCWATNAGGVWVSQLESETSSYREALKTATN
jgi:hypothetical protein